MKKAAFAIVAVLGSWSLMSAQSGGEWRAYGGDLRHQHYSPLREITATRIPAASTIVWPRPGFD